MPQPVEESPKEEAKICLEFYIRASLAEHWKRYAAEQKRIHERIKEYL